MTSHHRTHGTGGTRSLFVLVPALTFLVGLALGASLMWVADSGDDATSRAERTDIASPRAEPTSPSPGDVVVPAACVRAAQASEDMVQLIREAVRALGELDTWGLQRILDDLERLDRRVRADAAQCRPGPVPASPSD